MALRGLWGILFYKLWDFQTICNLASYSCAWVGTVCWFLTFPLFFLDGFLDSRITVFYFFCRHVLIRTLYLTCFITTCGKLPECCKWTQSWACPLIILHTEVSHNLSVCGYSGWTKRQMKSEKSKKEEATLHESYFSMFPSSKPDLLANTISQKLSNCWVHTFKNTN